MAQARPIAAALLSLLGALLVGCRSPAVPHPAGPLRGPRTAQSVRDPVAEVLTGLRRVVAIRGADPVRYRLEDRMQHYLVPGASIAVADGGRIVWARGFGVQSKDRRAEVTPHTLFQAASISKVVTATATLRLVDQGLLALDQDVNRYLTSWQVPESELTRTEKVTLRRILSHSAGLNGFSVGGYAPSEALPTLPQILDGLAPATTPAIRVQSVPGAQSRYSGGGVTIEQLLLEDITHEAFPALLQRLVLTPLAMQDSVFAPSRPQASEARAATGYDATGEPAVRTAHVEMAAAGLWSTPTDLLKWALEIAAARDGRSERVLSRATASAMLTRQKASFGLGPVLEGEGPSFRFLHAGWNDGFHAEVVYFPDTGRGACVMLNGDGGRPMVDEILFAIAAAYGWPDFAPARIEAIDVGAALRDELAGGYELEQPRHVALQITHEGGRLFLGPSPLGMRTELVFTSRAELVSLETGDHFFLTLDGAERVVGLKFGPFILAKRASDDLGGFPVRETVTAP